LPVMSSQLRRHEYETQTASSPTSWEGSVTICILQHHDANMSCSITMGGRRRT
jgi:hypothetical protein